MKVGVGEERGEMLAAAVVEFSTENFQNSGTGIVPVGIHDQVSIRGGHGA